MTSRGLERSRSWPQHIWAHYLDNGWRYGLCQWSTYRKWLSGNQMVTWPM